jgi:hypothetical protein
MGYEHGSVEKIVCCERDNDNLATALLAGGYGHKDNDALIASLLNGSNNQWNNPFIYLVWMMMANRMGWGGEGWNNPNTAQNIEIQSQLDSLRSQMQDNQNSNLIMDAIKGNACDIKNLASQLNCDFNTLNAAICDVRASVDKVGGLVGLTGERVINAVEKGNCGILEAVKSCCCETQKLIQQQGYENRIATLEQTNTLQKGQDFINRSIERGFSSSEFNSQRYKDEIIQAGNNNTQRLVDLLNSHWKEEQANQIQDLKFQLSQERQNRLLLSRLGGSGCSDNGCGGCGSCF